MTHLYYEMEIISKHILSFQARCGFWTPELFSLNCTQCFSVPCLFMSVMCKSPNVPAFESPAKSCSASREARISLPHCCSAPRGQAVPGDCSASLLLLRHSELSAPAHVYPHFSRKKRMADLACTDHLRKQDSLRAIK